MNLVYLVVGKKANYHYQCNFSLMSFLAKEEISNIFIYTDAPQYYQRISSLVHIIPLDESTIKEWKGDYDYFFRLKIKTIENVSLQNSHLPILYVDTDTFRYNSLHTIKCGVMNGDAFMHDDEGRMCNTKNSTYRLWKRIKGKEFSGVLMQESTKMWNSGVIALPVESQLECIQFAISILDEMCAQEVYWSMEQLAVGIALENYYVLKPAKDYIAHYWGNKTEWNHYIDNLFIEMFLKNYSQEEILNYFQTIDYKNIAYRKKNSSTARKITKLINNIFKDKNIEYLE